MIKDIGMVALGVFTCFCGMGMIEMAVTEPEYDLMARIFMGICGLILLVAGVVVTVLYAREVRIDAGYARPKEKAAALVGAVRSKMFPSFAVVSDDHDDTERLIRSFRDDYAAFFGHGETMGNDPVQRDATQICWHTLFLQKRRLEAKGIRLRMESERLRYSDASPVRAKGFFDGKYQVTDVSETVGATQAFVALSGKELYAKKRLRSARYRILHAARRGADGIVCPNCGNVATRENLIDGCDYCGTKFAVEDLGARVSAFGFQPDYEAEVVQHAATQETYGKGVALVVGIPIGILCIIGALVYGGDIEGPYTLRIAAVMFAAAFPTFGAVVVAEFFFFLVVYPLILAKRSITYYSKRRLQHMKERKLQDDTAERAVRADDRLFSIAGFYSEVQNELCAVHFAESAADATAFAHDAQAEAQIAACIARYRNCIDLELEDIHLAGYRVKGQLQEAEVTAELALLFEKDGHVSKKREKVHLLLVKAADCKTQAVCAPSFTMCGQCGASLSLLDGRACRYCGHVRDLAATGWAIAEYAVK